ncbi:hypothetical protein [Paenibacillus sp. OAS669]|uniref:hypothetical protein n=1 Tax=Paenibacillus sp. OAS669 TaxID=2663821 RepID=UPI00178AFE2D|nr:hypothetical protein [Paenibacillus sp. OAS669]MBE1444308.1 hypothetical protein [Paenibacillus sp. OAS669]
MNKLLRSLYAPIALSVAILPFATCASARGIEPINVQRPNFPVEVNGTRINVNETYSAYPLLLYKDTTYFPMTWNYAQGLGLSITWNPDSGLDIENGGDAVSELKQQDSDHENIETHFSAVLPSYEIKVNGKTIDNTREPYPVLNFRGVTYFPMTWRFAHDEFHMTTEWSVHEGFKIATQGKQIPVHQNRRN